MIAVVDYGMGNLRSVAKALQHVAPQASIVVTGDPPTIRNAERVVFPGQGAMPDCMRELETSGLRKAVADAARTKPFLGLCIGLQMLFEHSEEGDTQGLGLLPGKVKRFPRDGMLDARGDRLKVPHMGWNEVEQSVPPQRVHPLWHGIPQKARFYFVHSYFVETDDTKLPCATTDYAFRFTCAVARDNIFAVQFHPEKSQTAGLTLLRNFTQWRV